VNIFNPPEPLCGLLPLGAGSGVVVVSSGYQRLVVVSFKIEADLLAELDEVARQRNMSRSELIRRAIVRYVKYYVRPSVTRTMTIYHDYSNNNTSTPRIRFR
jgi:hypothetical protein